MRASLKVLFLCVLVVSTEVLKGNTNYYKKILYFNALNFVQLFLHTHGPSEQLSDPIGAMFSPGPFLYMNEASFKSFMYLPPGKPGDSS